VKTLLPALTATLGDASGSASCSDLDVAAAGLRACAALVAAARPLGGRSAARLEPARPEPGRPGTPGLDVPGLDVEALGAALAAPVEAWLGRAGAAGPRAAAAAVGAAAALLARLGDAESVRARTPALAAALTQPLARAETARKSTKSTNRRGTEIATLRAIREVAASPRAAALPPASVAAAERFCAARAQDPDARRDARVAALRTLAALVRRYGAGVATATDLGAMDAVAARCASDADATLAARAFDLAASALAASPRCAAAVGGAWTYAATGLLSRPTLPPEPQRSLLRFFEALARARPDGRRALVADLLAQAGGPSSGGGGGTPHIANSAGGAWPPAARAHAAACAARVLACGGGGARSTLDPARIEDFVAGCRSAVPAVAALHLLLLGELGRLGALAGTTGAAVEAVMERFDGAAPEAVTQAAAFALGSLAVASTAQRLPAILGCLGGGGSRTDAALRALHGLVDLHPDFAPHAEAVLEALAAMRGRATAAGRSLAAGCLARLALLRPRGALERIRGMCADDGAATGAGARTDRAWRRATGVEALRRCVRLCSDRAVRAAGAVRSSRVEADDRSARPDARIVALSVALEPALAAALELTPPAAVADPRGGTDWAATDAELCVGVERVRLVAAAAQSRPKTLRSRPRGAAAVWQALQPWGLGCVRDPESKRCKKDKTLIEFVQVGQIKSEHNHGKALVFAAAELMATLARTMPEGVVPDAAFLELAEKAASDSDEALSERALRTVAAVVAAVGAPTELLLKTKLVERVEKVVRRAKPEEAADLRQLRAAARCAHALGRMPGMRATKAWAPLLAAVTAQPVAKDLFDDLRREEERA
jgi:hypothetical protein